jgi:hypothetical protein
MLRVLPLKPDMGHEQQGLTNKQISLYHLCKQTEADLALKEEPSPLLVVQPQAAALAQSNHDHVPLL